MKESRFISTVRLKSLPLYISDSQKLTKDKIQKNDDLTRSINWDKTNLILNLQFVELILFPL